VIDARLIRVVLLAVRDTLPVWLLLEWLLWRLDPEREAWKAAWRAWGQNTWAEFLYQVVSGYPPGELRHWYAAPGKETPE
jgi:hypothetical protein